MSTTLQPRSAMYKGIRMRSRLEAAYAQYLDSHPFPWQYEPQCFADETGQYLPDFMLPGMGDGLGDLYVEIKPESILSPGRGLLEPALRRMKIIWSTDPQASLILKVGRGYPPTFDTAYSAWGAGDRRWRATPTAGRAV